jgi:hypothetical protein
MKELFILKMALVSFIKEPKLRDKIVRSLNLYLLMVYFKRRRSNFSYRTQTMITFCISPSLISSLRVLVLNNFTLNTSSNISLKLTYLKSKFFSIKSSRAITFNSSSHRFWIASMWSQMLHWAKVRTALVRYLPIISYSLWQVHLKMKACQQLYPTRHWNLRAV